MLFPRLRIPASRPAQTYSAYKSRLSLTCHFFGPVKASLSPYRGASAHLLQVRSGGHPFSLHAAVSLHTDCRSHVPHNLQEGHMFFTHQAATLHFLYILPVPLRNSLQLAHLPPFYKLPSLTLFRSLLRTFSHLHTSFPVPHLRLQYTIRRQSQTCSCTLRLANQVRLSRLVASKPRAHISATNPTSSLFLGQTASQLSPLILQSRHIGGKE